MLFSSDSRHVAAAVQRHGAWVIVLDGRIVMPIGGGFPKGSKVAFDAQGLLTYLVASNSGETTTIERVEIAVQ